MDGDSEVRTAPAGPALCSIEGLDKHYGGVHALKGVSLEFRAGDVHAIVGENGAGKSTLMKILAGVERADAGVVRVDGREVSFQTNADANAVGIAIVFQELNLYPELDVLANLFANREPRRLGVIRRREMVRRADPLLRRIGLSVDLRARVQTLRLDERQLIEISKALLVDPRVVILDEPTSALSTREKERLFGVVRGLQDRGVAVLFVSHRLEEVFAIADRISVLRDGRLVSTQPRAEITMAQVVEQMVGRSTDEGSRPRRSHTSRKRLSVRGLTLDRHFSNVSFDVECGEVVGLAGLEDAGVRPLLRTIFGVQAPGVGDVELPQTGRGASSPTAAVRAGVAYVPSDRRAGGLFLEQSIIDNVCQVTAGVTRQFGPLLSRRRMEQAATELCTGLGVKTASVRHQVAGLSGGNQQKVVLAKWIAAAPSLFLLDDPTRGVDIGAKFEIYDLIRRLAETGCAVVFYSTELVEYQHSCHRVLILRQGRVVAELSGADVTEEKLLHRINADAPQGVRRRGVSPGRGQPANCRPPKPADQYMNGVGLQ